MSVANAIHEALVNISESLRISAAAQSHSGTSGASGTSSSDAAIFAVPGGATDATAALQANIIAAQAAGVKLKLPAGTYTITPAAGGGLKIAAPLTIEADPRAIISTPAGTYNNCDLMNVAASNVTIEGGVWDWGSRVGSTSFIVNVVAGSNNFTMRGGTYQNAVWGCVQASDSSNVLYENCQFLGNAGGDINVICAGADVDGVTVRDCKFRCPASNYEAINVVNLSGGTKKLTNITIDGNNIVGSSAPTVGSCGIQIWTNANNYAPGPFAITNNYVYGFEIGFSPAFCTIGTVANNVARACKTIGFEMAGSSIACSGNVCEGDQITQYGFTADGAPNNNFSGNSARNCTLYAFSVTNGGSNNTVFTGCHALQDVAQGSYSAFAIFGVNNVTLSGCHVNYAKSTGGLGVYAVDVGGLTITGCSFQLASGTLGHVYIDNSTATVRDRIKVKSNTFTGAITGTNVRLIGSSFGPTVSVEQT